jgi:hypothetical protein
MKILCAAMLALATATAAASNITVVTPANDSQVSSTFQLTASATTCGGVPAVSMGYSIDSGSTTIEPIAFTAKASASTGAHVLHVKCWGKQTNDQKLLNITVVNTTVSDITITSPANGAKVISPFTLAASIKTCASESATSMGYSVDGGHTITEPTSFSVPVTANPGTHVVAVKCYGQNVQSQISLTVNVVLPPVAATPQFSLPSGTYTSQRAVTISEGTPGSVVYYTTDGSAPSTSSQRYSGPILVEKSMVLQAMAAASGYRNSGYALASYQLVQKSGPIVPSNAAQVTELQTLPGWRTKFDPATNGSATGSMTLVSDPSLSGQTAKFDTAFTNYGGVLYSVTYGKDPVPMNFLYDAQVWIESGSVIGNLEMDNNQVIDNGDTVIYAFQCAGDSNTWDYSENAGTRAAPIVRWVKSTASCNPATWTTDTWHHVQISYSRDDVGNVTYHSVWLDGVEAPINETVMSAFSLNWASGDLIANFQVDGTAASGSSTLYLDDLTLSRW